MDNRKVDKMWTKLALACFCCILATFITPAESKSSYQKYYLEDYCKDGIHNPGRITLGKTGKSTAIILEYTRSGVLSRLSRSCAVNVYAPDDSYAVVVSIREVKLREGLIFKTCDDGDRLRISTNPKYQVAYCNIKKDPLEHKSLISEGQNFANFELSHSSSIRKKEFEVVITAVKKPNGQNCSSSSFFECANKYCVAKELHCDGHNNCGDRTDETKDCSLSIGALITILLVIGLLVGVAIVIGFFIMKKRRSKSSGTVVTTTTDTQPPPPTQAEYQPMYPQPPPPMGGPPPPGMYVPPAPGPGYAPYPPMQPSPYGPPPADGSGAGYGSTNVVPPPPGGGYPPPAGGPYPPPTGYPSAPAGYPYPPPGTAPQPY